MCFSLKLKCIQLLVNNLQGNILFFVSGCTGHLQESACQCVLPVNSSSLTGVALLSGLFLGLIYFKKVISLKRRKMKLTCGAAWKRESGVICVYPAHLRWSDRPPALLRLQSTGTAAVVYRSCARKKGGATPLDLYALSARAFGNVRSSSATLYLIQFNIIKKEIH